MAWREVAWKTWLQTETCHTHIYAAQTNWGLKTQQGVETVCKASCLTGQICANTTLHRICVWSLALAVCMCVRVCVYVSVEGVALRLPKGDLAAATAWISHCLQWTIVRLLLRGLDIMEEAFKGKQKCCFTKRTRISRIEKSFLTATLWGGGVSLPHSHRPPLSIGCFHLSLSKSLCTCLICTHNPHYSFFLPELYKQNVAVLCEDSCVQTQDPIMLAHEADRARK